MPQKTPPKIRIDAYLVQFGLAPDLAKARALVMAGQVVVEDQRVDKPGMRLDPRARVRLKTGPEAFASRGGGKLWHALHDLGLEGAMDQAVVLDVGASTGGFTDCSLKLGARTVLALDVGSAQLAWDLRCDSRVVSLERTDLRDFTPERYPPIHWVLADVSFNSLARLAPHFKRAAPLPGTRFLVLVKPQFELSREEVPEGGIVDDPALRDKALFQVRAAFDQAGISFAASVESRVRGRHGNLEIFLYALGS